MNENRRDHFKQLKNTKVENIVIMKLHLIIDGSWVNEARVIMNCKTK